MAWVTVKEAAQALGVSEDTIQRRRKAGALPSQREPMKTGSGFRWLVEIPDDLAGAAAKPEGAAAGEHAAEQPSADALELATLRAQVAELRQMVGILERHNEELAADRDAWRDQAARADRIAERAQLLQERAQPAALPAGEPSHSVRVETAHSGASEPEHSGTDFAAAPARPPATFRARLRRWFMGEVL